MLAKYRNKANRFTSLIIGSGSMPTRCAELLMKKQHTITAMVSTDADVADWAKKNGLNYFESLEDINVNINTPVDYIFSINNQHILDSNVLRLATKSSINFHDSLLPKYAGTHATSWALMNGEPTHGITWHVIADKVDAGDILSQRVVEISDNETALTLNMKCYEAGIAAFDKLIDDLCTGSIKRVKQDLSERTFFPHHKQPDNGGIISWDLRAESISSLVRSLDFGKYPNALGKAKIIIDGEAFIVHSVEVCDNSSPQPPGTIVRIDNDHIQVTCADKDISIAKLSTVDGVEVSIANLARRFRLREGYRFVELPADCTARFAHLLDVTAANESYWVRKLSGLDPASVPFARESSSKMAATFRVLPIDLPPEFSEPVFSGLNKESLQIQLISAFGVLLSRLTESEKFSIGHISAQRTRKIDGLSSLFAAVVPIEFEIDERSPFSRLCERMATELTESLSRCTYLRDIAARYPELRFARGRTAAAFPVAFAAFDQITNFVPPSGTGLTLLWTGREAFWFYDTNGLDQTEIANISQIFVSLLANLFGNTGVTIRASSLLTDADRDRQLSRGKAKFAKYHNKQCIHELFEQQVMTSPDSIAIVSDKKKITYRELNARANQLAHYLTATGVQVGDMIGVAAERSIDSIVGIFGVLKAGGTYVPIDPSHSVERLTHIKNDTRAELVLSQKGRADRLTSHFPNIVCLDTDWSRIAVHPTVNPELEIPNNQPAYVIYTSGSTGKPKGVLISHRSLLHHATAISKQYELNPTDRVLQFSTFCFDVAAEEIFPTLSSGAAVVPLPEVERSSMRRFSEFLGRHMISVVNLPTSYWRVWTSSIASEGVPLPESIRLVVTGSEQVLPRDYNNWRRVSGTGVQWLNAYGLTETTITSLVFEPRDRNVDLEVIPVGSPIDNTVVYILDRNMSPVPDGMSGQLYIGGDGVALGYLNLPQLTSDRFLPDPFNEGALLYKTGDLARFLPDGNIEYLGRTDNQVKIRGIRIELGEIEMALTSIPWIEKAAVIDVDTKSGEKELAAYFVPAKSGDQSEGRSFRLCPTVDEHSFHDGLLHLAVSSVPTEQDSVEGGLSIKELRKLLSESLPNYMIPAAFVQLRDMPLTSNGKIDRKALPALFNANLKIDDYEEPRDEIETTLVRIWKDLLGRSSVGIYDNFFDLGGDSLRAVRMFAQIEEEFKKSIPLAVLFESGSIEALAQILRQENWEGPESVVVPIQPKGTKPPLFCIHARGGNVLFYRDLAKYLGEDQPFYAVQALRLGGRQIGHSTVEEMAEHYIDEIKRTQPVGPYFIGGASFGGLAAFEIAQQLYRNGEKVALLALIDTGTPDYPKLMSSTGILRQFIYSLIRRAQLHNEILLALDAKQRFQYVLKKLAKIRLTYRRKVVDRYKELVRNYYIRNRRANWIPVNYIQLEDQISNAGQKYSPEPYPGKLTLFRALKQPIGIEPDLTLGWGPFVSGELEIHEVPGHHGSIVFEPYVQALAEKLTQCISTSVAETGFDLEKEAERAPLPKHSNALTTYGGAV